MAHSGTRWALGSPWRHELTWVVGAAAALLVAQIAAFHSVRHDDAFITFRYGRNLVIGNGFVFSPGERVMGSTAPGHALLSALVHLLVGRDSLPSVMSALGCVGWMLQALAACRLLRKALGRASYIVGLFVALGVAWSYRYVAIETNLAAALMLLALTAAAERRWYAAAILCGIGGVVRADLFLLGLPLGVQCLVDLRRRAWKPALAGAACALPWFVFARVYFGTILPQTFAAKVGVATFGEQAIRVLNFPAKELWAMHFGWPTSDAISGMALLTYALAALGFVVLARADRRLWTLPATLLIYLCAYTLLRATIGTEWHLYPAYLILACLIVGGSLRAAQLLPRQPRGVVTACLSAPLVFLGYRMADFASGHSRDFWLGERHGALMATAGYLRAAAAPNDLLVTEATGTLGYFTDMRTLDLDALTTRNPTEALARVAGYRHWVAILPASWRPQKPPTCDGCVHLFHAPNGGDFVEHVWLESPDAPPPPLP